MTDDAHDPIATAYLELLFDVAHAAGARSERATLEAALAGRDLSLHHLAVGPLIVRGRLPDAMVAVVGARASDAYGLAVARRLAHELALRGIAVVSGGAEGCDHAAHVGALDAGGRTVVVLPSGHDHAYPHAHAGLYDRIVANDGAVVSPWWPTTPVAKHRFLARNRVIAGLARGVIVARAHVRSGSLSTARAAKSLGRLVAAVPGAVGEALSEGCHLLLDEGAVPMVGPRSMDRWLGREASNRRWPVLARGQPAPWADDAAPPRRSTLDAGSESILIAVHAEPGLDLDAIAVRTGTPIAALAAMVLGLEIEGVLERWPGGRYHVRAGPGE